MVKILCSAPDRIRVPARPAQHVHRRVPDLRSRTRRSAIYHRRRVTPDLLRRIKRERVPTSAVARERLVSSGLVRFL
jgi:hypothetical protein